MRSPVRSPTMREWLDLVLEQDIWAEGLEPIYFVAHNAKFDFKFKSFLLTLIDGALCGCLLHHGLLAGLPQPGLLVGGQRDVLGMIEEEARCPDVVDVRSAREARQGRDLHRGHGHRSHLVHPHHAHAGPHRRPGIQYQRFVP